MRPDVTDLHEFYGTLLGQQMRRALRRRIREIWPNLSGFRLLGLGYAVPYLRPFGEETERVLAMMPASQGVMHWPAENPNLAVLVDETELPLADYSIDRVLLVHGLETTEEIGPMLREIWRVLAPGGRLLVVVPNRSGLWARFEHTPFGQGRPYSQSQLSRLLRENDFSPLLSASAVFLPPSHRRTLLRMAPAFERFGRRWGNRVAGVIIAEAIKQVYAVTPLTANRRRRRRLVPVIRPLPATRSPLED